MEEYTELDTNSAGLELARWFVNGESFPDPLLMYDHTAAGEQPVGVEEPLTYLTDALGSVLALGDAAGRILERAPLAGTSAARIASRKPHARLASRSLSWR